MDTTLEGFQISRPGKSLEVGLVKMMFPFHSCWWFRNPKKQPGMSKTLRKYSTQPQLVRLPPDFERNHQQKRWGFVWIFVFIQGFPNFPQEGASERRPFKSWFHPYFFIQRIEKPICFAALLVFPSRKVDLGISHLGFMFLGAEIAVSVSGGDMYHTLLPFFSSHHGEFRHEILITRSPICSKQQKLFRGAY